MICQNTDKRLLNMELTAFLSRIRSGGTRLRPLLSRFRQVHLRTHFLSFFADPFSPQTSEPMEDLSKFFDELREWGRGEGE
jgi:hypothetical protein